jgi:hypothetical protein
MQYWTELGIAWGLTLILTLVVATIMHRPLFGVLRSICGTDASARFWTAYTDVAIVVGPLFLVSMTSLGADNLADFVRRAVGMIALGLILTVAVMGIAIFTGISPAPHNPAPIEKRVPTQPNPVGS